MTWTGVAIGGGAIVGALIGSHGAQSAANTQATAAENAQQISQNEFNTITKQEQPFIQSGYGAMNQLDYLLGIGDPGQYGNVGPPGNAFSPIGNSGGPHVQGGPSMGGEFNSPADNGMVRYGGPGSGMFDFGQGLTGAGGTDTGTPGGSFNSPGGGFGSLLQPFTADNWQQLSPMYNFQRQQGMQGVLGGDASNMGSLSGAAQKDLMSFNQNLANSSFNNAFNMYQAQQGNIYDRLAGVMQLGQSAAANTGQQGTALAGQAAQSATNIGTALGAGQIGSANAWANAASGVGYLPWLMQGGQTGGTPPETVGGGGAVPSDRRLKEDIKRIGKTNAGLPLYSYRYKGTDDRYFIGPMSDEVREIQPEAVFVGEDGFDRVHYGMLR